MVLLETLTCHTPQKRAFYRSTPPLVPFFWPPRAALHVPPSTHAACAVLVANELLAAAATPLEKVATERWFFLAVSLVLTAAQLLARPCCVARACRLNGAPGFRRAAPLLLSRASRLCEAATATTIPSSRVLLIMLLPPPAACCCVLCLYAPVGFFLVMPLVMLV